MVPAAQLCFAYQDSQGSIQHHQSVRTRFLTTAFPALWEKGVVANVLTSLSDRTDVVSSDWKNKPRFCLVHHVTGSYLWYSDSLVAAWAQLPHSTWDLCSPIRDWTRVTALADEFFTTGPRGKPPGAFFKAINVGGFLVDKAKGPKLKTPSGRPWVKNSSSAVWWWYWVAVHQSQWKTFFEASVITENSNEFPRMVWIISFSWWFPKASVGADLLIPGQTEWHPNNGPRSHSLTTQNRHFFFLP